VIARETQGVVVPVDRDSQEQQADHGQRDLNASCW
jgi:hypothetical protein